MTQCPGGCSNGECGPTCTAGWRCQDSSHRGYQGTDCSWSSVTTCPSGCMNEECKPVSTSENCVFEQDTQTCFATKEEAIRNVPTAIEPKGCFVWRDGPDKNYPWRVIPGTGCAHWVAHQLNIKNGNARCFEGYSIRVRDVVSGRIEIDEIKNCKIGDIWTESDLSHTGIIRELGEGKVFIEHDSINGVVTSWKSSGKCWAEYSTSPSEEVSTTTIPAVIITPQNVPDPKWTGNFYDDTDQMMLARAIFGEARNQDRLGKTAVGWVIRNRVDNPRWWGSNYHEVILAPSQFSCFNQNDNNLPILKDPINTQYEEQKRAWYESYEIAGQIINNFVSDPTNNADHYYNPAAASPSWDKSQTAPRIVIGSHIFIRLELQDKKIFQESHSPLQLPLQEVPTENSLSTAVTMNVPLESKDPIGQISHSVNEIIIKIKLIFEQLLH